MVLDVFVVQKHLSVWMGHDIRRLLAVAVDSLLEIHVCLFWKVVALLLRR